MNKENDKFISKPNELKLLQNDDIICKNCINKQDKVLFCLKYEKGKPVSILKGGECKYFEKE